MENSETQNPDNESKNPILSFYKNAGAALGLIAVVFGVILSVIEVVEKVSSKEIKVLATIQTEEYYYPPQIDDLLTKQSLESQTALNEILNKIKSNPNTLTSKKVVRDFFDYLLKSSTLLTHSDSIHTLLRNSNYIHIVSIINKDQKVLEDVKLDLDNEGVFTFMKHNEKVRFGKFKDTISLGILVPNIEYQVLIWGSKNLHNIYEDNQEIVLLSKHGQHQIKWFEKSIKHRLSGLIALIEEDNSILAFAILFIAVIFGMFISIGAELQRKTMLKNNTTNNHSHSRINSQSEPTLTPTQPEQPL